jgi:stage II sporulation protein D
MVPPMKNRIKKIFILLCILTLAQALPANQAQAAQSAHYIRVAILQDVSSFSLKINGPCQVLDDNTNAILYRIDNLNTTVTAYKNEILIAGKIFKNQRILIKAEDFAPIAINGRQFNGDIILIDKDNGSLLVINKIDLEDYVKGILYHESSHYWPPDALRAQAVVSRTYAVYQMQENRSKDFDVTSDIYSQVYGGKTSERFRTSEAVDDTMNEVLTYNKKIIPAYFHATCGGHTEDASLLWNIDIPPLKGVICVFCQGSPHFRWHDTVSINEIEKKLRLAGYSIKNIRDIKILGKDKSGRVTDLNIVSPGKNIRIPAKDFRNIIGPNIIRSTNFRVNLVDADAVFQGLGWGHGVGLCQWGAYFMAKQGYTYKDILKYYYPGTNVTPI